MFYNSFIFTSVTQEEPEQVEKDTEKQIKSISTTSEGNVNPSFELSQIKMQEFLNDTKVNKYYQELVIQGCLEKKQFWARYMYKLRELEKEDLKRRRLLLDKSSLLNIDKQQKTLELSNPEVKEDEDWTDLGQNHETSTNLSLEFGEADLIIEGETNKVQNQDININSTLSNNIETKSYQTIENCEQEQKPDEEQGWDQWE